MATALLAPGAYAGDGDGPVPGDGIMIEKMVCQGGGGMILAPATPDGSAVHIRFTPAAQTANAALPGPGRCAWADRLFGDNSTGFKESDGLVVSLALPSAPLMVEAAKVGGTFTVMARPVGDQFILVESVINVQVVDSTPLSPGPVDAVPAPVPAPGGGQSTTSTCGLPGGTATVVIADPAITTLNVRDKPMGSILSTVPEGSQVNVVGGCGVHLNAGIVAQQGGSQPPVPGWCAISSPAIGCVSEQFLVAGIPAGGQAGSTTSAGLVAPQAQAAAVAAPTFTGLWNATAQGSPYTMTLDQSGNSVTGSYIGGDGSSGQINGTVSGNVLRFNWSQQSDGLSGAGKFALSADGGSFTGSFTLGNNPDVADGSWNGTRR